MWQRTCAEMWVPLLEEARCQLIITAHQHRYQYFAPTPERPWAQLVGGGPEMGEEGGKKNPRLYPTVIEGEVHDAQLHITIHNLLSGNVQQALAIAPRAIRQKKKRKRDKA